MRLIVFANNWLGWRVTEFLKEQGDEILGLVLHPTARRKFGDEIVDAAGVAYANVFDGSELGSDRVLEMISALKPELGVSVMFGYLLRPSALGLFPKGCLNLHTSYPPYNRGAYPNVWSIIDGTPAGAMLHFMDEGVDTGDVVAKVEVPVEPIDTGATLYRKLELGALDLFKQTWPSIRSGQAKRMRQEPTGGSCHRSRDVEEVDRIDLERCYKARYLIDLLRARTFPPYQGAYFLDKGRRVYLRLELEYED